MSAVEQIFGNLGRAENAHFKGSSSGAQAFYDPDDPDSYESYLQALMDDAADYEDSFLSGQRSELQLYYEGQSPSLNETPSDPYRGEDPNSTFGDLLGHEQKARAARSTFVSTDVRDAVMMTLPSLMRLFGASESPVTIVPRSEAEAAMAEQATDYVNYVLWNDNPGFLNFHGAFKDALTVRTGFIKWWTDDRVEMRRKTFENVSQEQIQMLLAEDPTAKVKKLGKPRPVPQISSPMGGAPPAAGNSQGVPPGPAGQPPVGAGAVPPSPPLGPMAGPPPAPPPVIYDKVIIEYEVSKPLIKVAGVPPEEMRLDRWARTFQDSRLVGHERVTPAADLIAMGYDRDTVLANIQSSDTGGMTIEPQLRNPGRAMDSVMGDGVKYGEWFVKIDKDGDGFPELRRICTMGDSREIVMDEEANRIKFALFSVDPTSHTVVGSSLADYTKDLQRIKTNLARAVLDSAAESIFPRTVINELMVTVDDAESDDVGAIIRTRGDPSASVMFTNTPFLGRDVMPVMEMLNDVLARRTGLTDAAKGLDPKALQSSTQLGVDAIIQGAQERVELMARILAETGFRDLFAGVYNEICENPNQQRMLKLNGKYVPCDTSTFDPSMSVEVNPNIGKGSDTMRLAALSMIDQKQQGVINTYGLNNPICSVNEVLNTITDMLAISNLKNVGRFFKTPTPQVMQQFMSQPKAPDPMAMAAQAQQEKVRSDTAAKVAQLSFDQEKMIRDIAFKHAQLHAKTVVDMTKLGADQQGAQSQLMKDQADMAAQDQQSQMDLASANHEMQLAHQKGQNDIAIAQQKAQADMAIAHMKAQGDHQRANAKLEGDQQLGAAQALSQHQIGMAGVLSGHQVGSAKAASAHSLGQQKVDSAHDLGQQKVKSQHVLGALAAKNAKSDD